MSTTVKIPALLAGAAAMLLVVGCSRDARPDDTAAASETYEVTHQYGTTVIPVDAVNRTVVTSTALLDAALTVDVTPLGAPMSFQGYPAYLPDAEVTDLGDTEESLDLERIGSMNPGLILLNVGDDGIDAGDTQYRALSQIAPTVPIVGAEQDFELLAELAATAMNRQSQMDEAKQAYDERTAAVRAELAEVPAAQLPVSQLRFRDDHVRVTMETSNSGKVMADAGLTFAAPLPNADWETNRTFYSTSLELLPEAAGEHLFVYSTDEGVLEKTMAQPVWQQLSAVRNGTVHQVDFEPWMRGKGYLAANAILDDIEKAYGVDTVG